METTARCLFKVAMATCWEQPATNTERQVTLLCGFKAGFQKKECQQHLLSGSHQIESFFFFFF